MLVTLLYLSTGLTEQVCDPTTGCEKGYECRNVRSCAECSTRTLCIPTNMAMEVASCPSGLQPVLVSMAATFYSPLRCTNPTDPKCQDNGQQCNSNVCCAPAALLSQDKRAAATTTAAVDACPPSCRIGCKYGMDVDDNGCPMCSCFDPCRTTSCDAGYICDAVTSAGECTDVSCRHLVQTRCVVDMRCPAVQCRTVCPYGNVLDQQGCPLCACHDPCAAMTCGNGQVCVLEQVNNCGLNTCKPKPICAPFSLFSVPSTTTTKMTTPTTTTTTTTTPTTTTTTRTTAQPAMGRAQCPTSDSGQPDWIGTTCGLRQQTCGADEVCCQSRMLPVISVCRQAVNAVTEKPVSPFCQMLAALFGRFGGFDLKRIFPQCA